MRKVLAIVALLLGSGPALVRAQGAPPVAAPAVLAPSSPLDSLRFLLGTWQGEGKGQPGQGRGSASFEPDLGGRVLIRRSRSEYPATAGRPATIHEDLMVISVAPGGGNFEAMYFETRDT